MRKLRTLSLTLALLLLVPSFLMASPSTWGWLQNEGSSETLEMPAETSPEEPSKSMTASKSSKNSSDDDLVIIKKSELKQIVTDAVEGNNLAKKGGAAVTEAVDTYVEGTKPYKESKFQTFGVVEGGFAAEGFSLGVGAGFIFKDALIMKLGVEKKNILDMSNWLDMKNAYRVTGSVGIIF